MRRPTKNLGNSLVVNRSGFLRLIGAAIVSAMPGFGLALADDIDVGQGPGNGPAAALQGAEQAIGAARAAGNVWLATPRHLRRAHAAAKNGDAAMAITLANRARREAELALNQAQLERARYLLDNRSAIEPSLRTAVGELIAANDGAAAIALLDRAGISL